MGYAEIAGHPLTYAAVVIGILYVLGFTIICLRRAWKRALAAGFERQKLWGIIKTSVSFALVPSLAILVGFFSLASWLGLPLAWWRLSVIGSVTYEIMAAEMVMNTRGIELATAGARDFILIAYVMTLGMMGGLVIDLVGTKGVHRGTLRLKQKDRRWGVLGNSVFLLVIVLVFAIPVILSGGVRLLTLVTGAAVSLALVFIIKKTGARWLNDFILAISMILAWHRRSSGLPCCGKPDFYIVRRNDYEERYHTKG
jgi:hypothetical protein